MASSKLAMKKEAVRFHLAVEAAMKRVPRRARKVARMHGTPIYVWENGKVVARKP